MRRFAQLSAILSLFVAFAAPAAHADDPAQPIYTYNDAGLVVLATYPDGSAFTYTYDADGIVNVVQVMNASDSGTSQ